MTINENPALVALLYQVRSLEKSVCAGSISPEARLLTAFPRYAASRPLDNQKASFLQGRLSLLAFDARNQARFLFESSLTCFKHTFMLTTCQG